MKGSMQDYTQDHVQNPTQELNTPIANESSLKTESQIKDQMSVSKLEEHVLALRINELAARDLILIELRKPEFTRVWKLAGHRNLREYCEETLSYGPLETREILVKIGHILTRDSMMSNDAATNERIKKLISWRSRTALEARLPAYRVLSNRTLLAVANENPKDLTSLEAINGIGHVKVRNFGEALLKTLEI